MWLFVLAAMIGPALSTLCPQNLGSNFWIVTDATSYGSAQAACQAEAGNLLFAQIPDLETAQGLALLLSVCGGTNMYIKGYQGQGLGGAQECAILRLGGLDDDLVQLGAGGECAGQTFVLCTDKAAFAEVVVDNVDATVTSTVTVTDTQTVSTGTTISATVSVQETDVTISVASVTVQVFTTTLPTVSVIGGTETTELVRTVTETEGVTTDLTTLIVGPVTITLTNLIPLTMQSNVHVPSTLTITGTDSVTTCIESEIVSTAFIVSTLTEITTTVINRTVTSVVNTCVSSVSSSTTSAICPTRKISTCPCEPDRDGFIYINNHVPFEEALCACNRVGAELASIDDYDVEAAAAILKKCSQAAGDEKMLQHLKKRCAAAWIGSWRGEKTDAADLCLVLHTDGSVRPQECADRKPVVCRVPYWVVESGCHSCQFRWRPHCAQCPSCSQRRNPFGAVCYDCRRDSSESSGASDSDASEHSSHSSREDSESEHGDKKQNDKKKNKKDRKTEEQHARKDSKKKGKRHAGAIKEEEARNEASENSDDANAQHATQDTLESDAPDGAQPNAMLKSAPVAAPGSTTKTTNHHDQISFNLCPFPEDLIFAITDFDDNGLGLTHSQICGLQGASLLNVTAFNLDAGLKVLSMCAVPDGWVKGYGLAQGGVSCATLHGPAGGMSWKVTFDLNEENCAAAKAVLCQWPSKQAIPPGFFRDHVAAKAAAAVAGTDGAEQATITATTTQTDFVTETTTVLTTTASQISTVVVGTTTVSSIITLTSTLRTVSTPPTQTVTVTIVQFDTETTRVPSTVSLTSLSVLISTDTLDVFTNVATTTRTVYMATAYETGTVTILSCSA